MGNTTSTPGHCRTLAESNQFKPDKQQSSFFNDWFVPAEERSFPCKLEAVSERQTKKIVDVEVEKKCHKSGFLGLEPFTSTSCVTRPEEKIVYTAYYGKFTVTPEMFAYEQEIIQLLKSQLSPWYGTHIISNKPDIAIFVKSPRFMSTPIGTDIHLKLTIKEEMVSSREIKFTLKWLPVKSSISVPPTNTEITASE